METAAIPPMTPPATAPAFEPVCPPTGIDVPVFDDAAIEDPVFEAETETGMLDAPSTVPGRSSGVSESTTGV